jgi:TolB-like protein
MAGEIFISYRRSDVAWATLLHAQLRAEGVEAWYDAQIGAGQDWRTATAKALQTSHIFVLLFSKAAAESEDIAKELAAAIFSKKMVVPVRIENIEPTGAFLYELASRNWVNAFDNTEAKLAELAHSLAKLVKDGIADESIIPFDRNAGGKAKPTWLVHNRFTLAGAALVVIAAGAGAFWMLSHKPAPAAQAQAAALRIAVLPFEVLSDDAGLRQFAGGLKAELVAQLSQKRLPVVSDQGSAALKGQDLAAAVAKLHVAYVFAGTIERSGKQLLVRAHLDDTRQNIAVWSQDFTGDSSDPRALQNEISTQAIVMGSVVVGYDKMANGDTDTMRLFIQSVQYSLNDMPGNTEAKWNNAKKLSEKFPDDAEFEAYLAGVSISLAFESTPERAAELRAAAKTEVQHALARDPHNSYIYGAELSFFPSVGHWAEREKILLDSPVVPKDALVKSESDFLREVGRLDDAVAYGRQAQAAFPLTADPTLILALGTAGNSFEAGPLAESAAKSFPSSPAVWTARFESAIFNSQWDDALALLAPGDYVPLPGPVADAWRSALKAAKSGNPGAKRDAVRLIIRLDTAAIRPASSLNDPMASDEAMTPGGAIAMLAILGDKDAAFAQAKAYLKRDSYADSSFLFWPNLAEFRRDPRFMPLAVQIGLADYWRTSGKWPDFCTRQTLPYDCQAAANTLKVAK